MRVSKRVDQIQGAVIVLAEGVARAEDMIEINLAGADARAQIDDLPTRQQRARRSCWVIAATLFLSELLAIGPVDFGVIPNLHPFKALVGHPYSEEAGKALYGGVQGRPHFLAVPLPWSNLV